MIVIYTDLDGSLLDHHSYSHAAADALLLELEQRGIPVIPTSSKTRAELIPLRRELNNHHPLSDINLISTSDWQDLISRQNIDAVDASITLGPYQVLWITNQ